MFIFTFLSTFLILSRGKIRRGNDGYSASGNDWNPLLSVSQEADLFPNYDITYWIRQFQIEHCVFVEIGEGFRVLVVGVHESPFITKIADSSYIMELLLGLYSYTNLHFWNLCSIEVTKFRKSHHVFVEDMVYVNRSVQVYPRLYNVSLLYTKAPICNYFMIITSWQSHKIRGFSICFQSSLPKFLHISLNAYKIVKYSAKTINGTCSIKCSNFHQEQPFHECVRFWTSLPSLIASSWIQGSSLVCDDTCTDEPIMVVASCYNQVTGKGAIVAVGLILFCTKSTQKDTRVYALKEDLCDNGQEIDEVLYDNDYKEETLLVIPKDVRSIRSLRRRLLQSVGQEYYGNMDYNVEGDKFNYKGYARYVSPIKREDEDEGNEDYDVSDDKGDAPEEEEEENENENEDEDDDEFGHERRRIRMARSKYAVFPHTGKKQKKYLTKENIRIRSVTEECNEEPTEELQYYDYETSGIDALFGNIHKLQIGYLTGLILVYSSLTFTIWM